VADLGYCSRVPAAGVRLVDTKGEYFGTREARAASGCFGCGAGAGGAAWGRGGGGREQADGSARGGNFGSRPRPSRREDRRDYWYGKRRVIDGDFIHHFDDGDLIQHVDDGDLIYHFDGCNWFDHEQ
jgi:hypothetical protein